MLKKEFRLPKGHFKSEKVLSSPVYVLKLAKNGKPFSRFGVVVSKKVDKRATVRNRIKRKFRSCIESSLASIVAGYDFLFVFKKISEENELCQMFLTQFKKEKLIQ